MCLGETNAFFFLLCTQFVTPLVFFVSHGYLIQPRSREVSIIYFFPLCVSAFPVFGVIAHSL